MKIAALLLAAAAAMPAAAEEALPEVARAGLALPGYESLLARNGSRAVEAPSSRTPVCPPPGQATAAVAEARTGIVPPEPSVPRLIFAALAAIAWTVARRLKR